MARTESPKRVRLSVPQADVSVIEWLAQQHEISLSLRILIKESIQREGITDVANRPVVQLPRRGRPVQISQAGVMPAAEANTAVADDDDVDADDDAAAPESAHQQRAEAAQSQAQSQSQQEPKPEQTTASAEENADEPAVHQAASESAPSKQVSIDEIMSSTRR